MKCLFLYNPNSGKGKIQKKLPLIERTLKTRYDEVALYATKSAEDLQKKVAEGAEEYDAIVFSGGDGTFNLVLGALGEREVELGYLPSGTANDVARSLGISKHIKKALKVVTDGRSEKVDCMRVGETDYAMYIVAAGAFTSVTYSTPQKKKKRFGWLGYLSECWKKHMKFNSFPIEVTCGGRTEETKAVLILVMNGLSRQQKGEHAGREIGDRNSARTRRVGLLRQTARDVRNRTALYFRFEVRGQTPPAAYGGQRFR